MKYITLFETAAAYNAATLDLPNVSLVEETMSVSYNPYVDPYGGHDYVEIGGLKWATINVGANSIIDKGLYFQWGDTQGYTTDQVGSGEGKKYFDYNWSDYKWTEDYGETFTKYNDNDYTVLQPSDDAVIANWGGNWRMPTTAEYVALGNAVNTVWTTDYQGSGVAGIICTDKTDSSKILFFPACGHCRNGNVVSVGNWGYYWSSSLNSSYVKNAYYMEIYNGSVSWKSSTSRCEGFPVRAVAD